MLDEATLRSLDVPEEAICRILDAHREALDNLTARMDAANAERDIALADLEAQRQTTAQVQEELTALHGEVDADLAARRQTARRTVLEALLKEAGANEQAIPLLATALPTDETDWDGDALLNAPAVLARVTEPYAAFFSRAVPQPTTAVAPPLSPGAPLSLTDLRAMSTDEINSRWPLVRQALTNRC